MSNNEETNFYYIRVQNALGQLSPEEQIDMFQKFGSALSEKGIDQLEVFKTALETMLKERKSATILKALSDMQDIISTRNKNESLLGFINEVEEAKARLENNYNGFGK